MRQMSELDTIICQDTDLKTTTSAAELYKNYSKF